jgi:hypothetical protein
MKEQIFVFIYKKGLEIKALTIKESQSLHDHLLKDGWVHDSTLDACTFIKYKLNEESKNELHPVQIELLEKYGLNSQIGKLQEEMQELAHEIYMNVNFENPINKESFYREFLDVRNLMQQIESKLDTQLLEKYEAEMFEKAKTKYLDK